VFRPPLRFGLIGCGQQGRLLAAALRRVADTQLIACSDPDPVALNAVPGARVARFADYRALLDAMAVRAARPPAVTGTDAVRVLEVLDAIVLSADRGQPVTLERTP
jgi:predicted dehydrogenase